MTNLQIKCVIVFVLMFWVLLNLPDFFGNKVNSAWAATEGWQSAPEGTIRPDDEIPGFFGDMGAWLIADTVSEFPECGRTPHTAKVLTWEGSRSLQLNSGTSIASGGCADNIWAVLFTDLVIPGYLDQHIHIPITRTTNISFKESGALTGLGALGWGGGGDRVSLSIEDNRGNTVVYILQRDSSVSPDPEFYSNEILLDPNAKTYKRSLFNDFSQISRFNPAGATIRSIVFEVDEHGSATIDNIEISEGPPPIEYNPYDTNENCVIDDFELLKAIDDWAANILDDFDLLNLIDKWAEGSYC